jgi:cbb3-type cytochrome oxidase cytochrome c subunit
MAPERLLQYPERFFGEGARKVKTFHAGAEYAVDWHDVHVLSPRANMPSGVPF